MFKKQAFRWGFLFVLVLFLTNCKPENDGDKEGPALTSSTPEPGDTAVALGTILELKFSEKFYLIDNPQITLNGKVVKAALSYQKLTIDTELTGNTSYILEIPAGTLYDDAGNYNKSLLLPFKTVKGIAPEGTVFEAEKATLTGSAAVATSLNGYSGTGYVSSGDGNVTFSVQADQDGYYRLTVRYHTMSSAKQNDLYVDDGLICTLSFEAVSFWTTLSAGEIYLTAGVHSLSLVKNWGWTNYDYVTLAYDSAGLTPFRIAASLVTPNPSSQAVRVYDFLKGNFGSKVLSGTMAAYSTNITEATWVHEHTGKWPALTCFDFVDHTNPNQNWVNYSAPFTLGADWWNNNGLVALMWHWRDPLTKSGSMYTYSSSKPSGTTFDVSNVTDTTSNEYQAMIVDLDVIAGYLKQFRDAGIPVLWRPLHEASGTWFWWGAKGPVPFKTLWKLMFNRFTNVHGLNNLIWVWTSDANASTVDWYPGDEYVDLIGMDIYPGENQHGSQYYSFNRIRKLFGGRKLITLSECGSVPDPASMKAYGDMWSYFMPWNGYYTESDSHNGAAWWNKFFSYDYVVTRDQMPNLK
ncbi:MAG: glycosyl hydrolase [Bacteroidota bacterium]|nr:glycosyl hydrolase [Bacteroidota bacterium]